MNKVVPSIEKKSSSAKKQDNLSSRTAERKRDNSNNSTPSIIVLSIPFFSPIVVDSRSQEKHLDQASVTRHKYATKEKSSCNLM